MNITSILINELNKMYDSEFYTSRNGYCKYYDECKKGINAINKFYSDRVKIGEKYGINNDFPKILFVGLEGVHSSDICNQKINEIDINSDGSKPSLSASNNHYRGVRYVNSYILSGLKNNTKPKDAKIETLNAPEYIDYLKHICLSNIYKCAFSEKKSGLPHSAGMKCHCEEILLREIEILKPDLLVIQIVSNLPNNFWKEMQKRFGEDEVKLIKSSDRKDNTSVYKMTYSDGKTFYCLWTYHGNGRPCKNGKGGVFVNNKKYITVKLNPVLDKTIELLRDEIWFS